MSRSSLVRVFMPLSPRLLQHFNYRRFDDYNVAASQTAAPSRVRTRKTDDVVFALERLGGMVSRPLRALGRCNTSSQTRFSNKITLLLHDQFQ